MASLLRWFLALSLIISLSPTPHKSLRCFAVAAEDEAVADADAPLGIDDADDQEEDAGAETRGVSIGDDGAAAGATGARVAAKKSRTREWACGPVVKEQVSTLRSRIDSAGGAARTTLFTNGWRFEAADPLVGKPQIDARSQTGFMQRMSAFGCQTCYFLSTSWRLLAHTAARTSL